MRAMFTNFMLRVLPFDEELAYLTASLRQTTFKHGSRSRRPGLFGGGFAFRPFGLDRRSEMAKRRYRRGTALHPRIHLARLRQGRSPSARRTHENEGASAASSVEKQKDSVIASKAPVDAARTYVQRNRGLFAFF